MSLKTNWDKVLANVRTAGTEDLMDRVTFYRAGMEPPAVEIIEAELRRRGITEQDLEEWGPKPDDSYIWLEDGSVAPCSYCSRPAIRTGWRWHRLWGKLPVFPRLFRYCKDHGGVAQADSDKTEGTDGDLD